MFRLPYFQAVLQPGTDFYSKLGEECVKAGCAVDLFLFPNAFVDVASLSPVCALTGGSIYKYQYFEVNNIHAHQSCFSFAAFIIILTMFLGTKR